MATSRFIDWLRNLTAKSTTIDGTEQVHIDSSGLSQKATLKNAVSYTAPVLEQDWSSAGRGAGGATVTGIKFDATGTDATSSTSLLMDLQVGGASKFKVGKAGQISAATATKAAPSYSFNGNSNSGFYTRASNYIMFAVSGNESAYLSGAGVLTVGGTAAAISFGGSSLDLAGPDAFLVRDAANTLAQRNGTNAQESRLYGTYTDASNYRRLTYKMSTAGVAELKPEGAGTGASGNVLYISGLPTSNPGPGILWNDAGTVKVGT